MSTSTPDPSVPRTWPGWAAGILAAAVLAAGEPLVSGAPSFSAGYVVRRMALALAAGLLLVIAAWLPSRLAAPRARSLAWLLAPLGIVFLGLLTVAGTGPRALVRHGVVWAALAFLPLVLARAFEIPRAARRAWWMVTGVGAVLCLCGLFEVAGGGRMAASFGRPAVAGAIFGALIVPCALLVPHRVAAGIGAGLLTAGCVMSDSRAAVVGALLGGLIGVSSALANRRVGKRLLLMGAGTAALLVLWIGLGVAGTVPLPGNPKTVDVRMGLYRGGLSLVAERPVTGHGLGRYESEALRVRDLTEARLEPGRRPEHAHLDLLHVATEGGIGAGLLLLVWLAGAVLLARRRLVTDDPVRRRHASAALAVLVTLGVAGLADGVLIDPGPVLLAALAVASLLSMGNRSEEPVDAPRVLRLGAALAGLGLLGAAFLLRADVKGDAILQRYVNARVALRTALARGATDTAVEHARREASAAWAGLQDGFVWQSDNAELWYQHGVGNAEHGDTLKAASAFRRAFELDPGKTEARLDLARLMQLDGRLDDAKAVLREAGRRDPTRYDLWMRLGHLEIGPEPTPGDAPPADVDWVKALNRYNTAREKAPSRFEYDVAIVRMDRRKATTPEEIRALDLRLEEIAGRFARKDATPLEKFAAAPAEVQVEAFRVAEAMGAGDAFTNSLLRMALRKDPDVAIVMRRESDRLLAEGQRREDEAKKKAASFVDPDTGTVDPSKFDPKAFRGADRAFGAAAVRLAALLQEGGLDPIDQLTQARGERELKRFRMSLARYRGLLAAIQDRATAAAMLEDAEGGTSWRADLLREAAVVAQKVDAPLARTLWTRSFTLQAESYVRTDELDRALSLLTRALEHYDADFPDAHYLTARVHARRGAADKAAASLLRALELGPHWRIPAMQEDDFAELRKRPEVQRALRN